MHQLHVRTSHSMDAPRGSGRAGGMGTWVWGGSESEALIWVRNEERGRRGMGEGGARSGEIRLHLRVHLEPSKMAQHRLNQV